MFELSAVPLTPLCDERGYPRKVQGFMNFFLWLLWLVAAATKDICKDGIPQLQLSGLYQDFGTCVNNLII
jgi:hypothetical protein